MKHIYLYQEIVEDFWARWGYGISSAMVVEALQDVNGDDDLLVHINGPGGDAVESFAIYSALAMHPAHVTTRIESLAASGHGIISQAGDVRQILELADFMMHSAWGGAVGEPVDLRKAADRLERVNEKQSKVFAKRGDLDDYTELLAAETWYTGQELVDVGLADEMLDPMEFSDIDVSVAMDRRRFEKMWKKAPDRVYDRAVSPMAVFGGVTRAEAIRGKKAENHRAFRVFDDSETRDVNRENSDASAMRLKRLNATRALANPENTA